MPRTILLLSTTLSLGCLLTTGSAWSQEPMASSTGPLHGYQVAVTLHTADRHGIFVVDSVGKQPRQLTSHEMDHSPAWSPEGGRIAFLSLRQADFADAAQHDLAGHWFLYVMDADGSNQVRVSSTPVSSFQWLPDGKSFLFVSSFEDPSNRELDGTISSAIYLMDGNGGNLRRLTPVAGHDSVPALSADGTRIAFTSERDGGSGLYIMEVEGGELRKIVETSGAEASPVWSLDSTKLAFALRARGSNERTSIHIAAVDGQGSKRLAGDFGAYAIPLDWSPDGRWLLVHDDGRLHGVSLEAGKRVQLQAEGPCAPEGKFLRDSAHVLYRVRRNNEWMLMVDRLHDKQQHLIIGSAITFSVRSTDENAAVADEM